MAKLEQDLSDSSSSSLSPDDFKLDSYKNKEEPMQGGKEIDTAWIKGVFES